MVRVKIPIVVAAICVLLFAATHPVKAEWISVAPFKGVVTDVYPAAPNFAFARRSTGWTISPTGELRRLSWNRMALSSGRLDPVTFIGPHPDQNSPALTVVIGSTPYKYNLMTDAISAYTAAVWLDTVKYWADDSVYHRSNMPADSSAGSRFLELTLANIQSLVIGGVDTRILGIYNDWLIRAPDVIGSTDTATIGSVPVSISTDPPPGMFNANETTFVADGGTRFKYLTNDTATVLTYPTYTDTGTTAQVYKYGNNLVVRIDSSVMASPYTNYFMLLSVKTAPNGIPFSVYNRLSDSSGWIKFTLTADSSYYANTFCLDTITSYVIFKPSAVKPYYNLGSVTGDYDYLGSYGGNYYGVFRPRVPRGETFGGAIDIATSLSTTIEGRQFGMASYSLHPASNGTGDSMYVYLDFSSGTGQTADIRCAIYRWHGASVASSLLDTTNIRSFTVGGGGGATDGWYGFKLQNAPALYADSGYAVHVMSSSMAAADVGTKYGGGYDSATAYSPETTWVSPRSFTKTSNKHVAITVVMTQTGDLPSIPTVENQRSFDCRMVRFSLSNPGYWHIDKYKGQAKIIKSTVGDTLMLYLWSNYASATPSDGSYMTLYLGENPKLPVPSAPGAGGNAYGFTISALHRFRAFYAGGDPANFLGWSMDNNYDSISGGEYLEGDDPIRALSSLGGDLTIYRRHRLQGLQGSSIADFYFIPSPAGVGAVSQYSVARNPADNCDYFINELGLWRHCAGGGVEQVSSQFASLFADSVYWLNETQFQAVIFDDKYWVTMQFKRPAYDPVTMGSYVGSWRLLTFDLTNCETPQMTFIESPDAGPMYVTRFEKGGAWGGAERFYAGDVDSSILYRLNEDYTYPGDPYRGQDEVYELSDYRSCWMEGSGRDVQKRVLGYEMAYTTNGVGDTIKVDFYTDYSETAVWTDVITKTAAGRSTKYRSVSRAVQGQSVAFGIRASDSADVVHGMSLNVIEAGKRRKD